MIHDHDSCYEWSEFKIFKIVLLLLLLKSLFYQTIIFETLNEKEVNPISSLII
jgi:hypothetical protein